MDKNKGCRPFHLAKQQQQKQQQYIKLSFGQPQKNKKT